MKPIIYLDVDGIVSNMNPDSDHWKDLTSNTTEWKDRGNSYLTETRTSKLLGKALLNLGAELKWLSPYGEQVNDLISPLMGLPELPVIKVIEDWILLDENNGGRPYLSHEDKIDYILMNTMKNHNQPFILPCYEKFDFDADTALSEQGYKYATFMTTSKFGGLTPGHIVYMRDWLLYQARL